MRLCTCENYPQDKLLKEKQDEGNLYPGLLNEERLYRYACIYVHNA